MELSMDLMVRMKKDPFLTALNKFVSIHTLEHEFIGGEIWFSIFDLEDKLHEIIMDRSCEITRKLFKPIFKGAIKGTQGCVARTNSGRLLISQRGLQDLLFFMEGDFPRRFRIEYSKCFHCDGNPDDPIVNLPGLLRNLSFRGEFTDAIVKLDKLNNE